MNKINQTKDFLLPFPNNGIAEPEIDNFCNLSKIPEDKSFSDLNFFSLGIKPHNIDYELKNDLSNNPLDDFQFSKKSESELEFEFISKTLEKNKNEFDEVQKYLKSSIPIPILRKCDFIEKHLGLLPLKEFDDCNYNINYNSDNYNNEKILEKNENENENELTNQNNGIFYKMHKRKITNKLKKNKIFSYNNSK